MLSTNACSLTEAEQYVQHMLSPNACSLTEAEQYNACSTYNTRSLLTHALTETEHYDTRSQYNSIAV